MEGKRQSAAPDRQERQKREIHLAANLVLDLLAKNNISYKTAVGALEEARQKLKDRAIIV